MTFLSRRIQEGQVWPPQGYCSCRHICILVFRSPIVFVLALIWLRIYSVLNYHVSSTEGDISVRINIEVTFIFMLVGLGGLRITCSPRDPRFTDLNPAEVDGFFSGRKNPVHKSSGRDFKLGVPSLRFQAC